MRAFEFATTGRIVFGAGTFGQLPGIAEGYGRRPLIVTGKRVRAELPGARFSVAGEPTIDTIREGVAAFWDSACDCVIAIGGGSAIDAGKAIAAAAANSGDLLDYLEVIGKGQPLENAPWPFIAVPTTAGTGSEVTRNAVLGSSEQGVKVSLRSPLMLPRVAIVDSELTLGLPPAITASTGLDALTQLIEPYVSTRANLFTDSLCLDGIRRASENLPRAYSDGSDIEARSGMAYASLLGGLALANAGLGVVHGFAAPVGGMFDAPHGAVCAAILPAGMSANIAALRERASESPALERYGEIACILTDNPDATPEDGAEWVRNLAAQLMIPSLSAYGVCEDNIPDLVIKAGRANSMKANPIALTGAELAAVLERSL
ncbi:MAG TPA: iron-containing alcohol dehydrogenase [Bryobacteraceae bacterium]